MIATRWKPLSRGKHSKLENDELASMGIRCQKERGGGNNIREGKGRMDKRGYIEE